MLKRVLEKARHRSNYDYLLMLSIIAYGLIFSFFTLAKHYGFATFAWDLGIFDQISYSTVFGGKFMYTTTELYLNPTGCYFAIHFSPILFVLLPFYAILPSAGTLLILQSFILALGALPLYFLASRVLDSKKNGFLLSLAYLLFPAVQASNWFDFHQQAFIPVLVFSTCYFLMKKSWKLYFVSVLLALMIEEHVAPIIFLIALYFLLTQVDLRSALKSIRSLQFHPDTISKVLILTIVLSVGFYFLARYTRSQFPINSDFWDVYRAADTFKALGFQGDILYLPFYVLMNPIATAQAFMTDYAYKLFFLISLFAPLLFLSFKSKLTIVTLLILAPFLLTNYPPYYMLGAQYPLHVVPLIFLGAVEGLGNRRILVQDKPKEKINQASRPRGNHIGATSKTILVVSLIFIIVLSPLSPVASIINHNVPLLWYATSNYDQESAEAMHGMIALIPHNASVLTQNILFPHISNRVNAYVVPVIDSSSVHGFFENYIRQEINESDYILLDLRAYDIWKDFVLNEVSNNKSFKTYAVTHSFVLFRRNYDGPLVFIPNIDYASYAVQTDLTLSSGTIVTDETAPNKIAALSQQGVHYGTLVYGPYVCLPPGTYNVNFEIKVPNSTAEKVATLDIAANLGQSIFVSEDLYGNNVPNHGWTNVTLVFSLSNFTTLVEFRVLADGVADVYIDRVIIATS